MTGKFLKIKCPNGKCNNAQNIYSKASRDVKCLVCEQLLARATGGNVKLSDGVRVLKELD